MDVFKDEFVPNEEASTGHKNWAKSNKGELALWVKYRDAVIAHKKGDPPVAVPTMATRHGKALIAAGKEHMSVIDLGSVYPDPNPPPPPPPPGTEPAAIAGQGYHVAFFDDFLGTDLDSSKWIRAGWPGYQVTPGTDAVVANNILSIHSRRANGYPNRNVSTRISPPGQVNAGPNWLNGYFECRSKYPAGKGSWPAFWLFSEHWLEINGDRNQTPPYVSEIDIMEAGPGLGGLYLNAYNHVVHSNTGGDGVNDPKDAFAPTGAAQFASPNIGDLTLGFHTYGCLWTPTQVSFYCDNIFLASCPPWPNSTQQPMFMILSQWASHGQWPGSTDATTPDPLTHQIDWVKVWQL